MKRPPLPALKLSLLLVLMALLLAIVGTLWSRGLARDAALALQQQNTALNGARQQLDRSRQQQQLIATHLPAYQALAARGFIGAEDRLVWIEAVQQANRDAGLYGLDYRLTPRTPSLPALARGLAAGPDHDDADPAPAGGNRSHALSGCTQGTRAPRALSHSGLHACRG